MRYYLIWGMAVWWTVSLAAACGTPEPGSSIPTLGVSSVSPLPTSTSAARVQSTLASVSPLEPAPAATPTPGLTSGPQTQAIRLLVLHTNDNWGETLPCG